MILSSAPAVFATQFEQFDNLTIWDQSEYFARMIDAAQIALTREGHADLAAQMDQLFTAVEPGDTLAPVLVALDENIDRARVADAKRHAQDHQNSRIEVEAALIVTLQKSKIPISAEVKAAIYSAMADFHGETYGEFEARPAAEKRRFIAQLIKFAWPDYEIRDEVRMRVEEGHKGETKKGYSYFDPETQGAIRTIVAKEFPSQSPVQPGFAEVAKQIDIAYAKSANKSGPLYEITIYMLRQQDEGLGREIEEMIKGTAHMPR